MNRIRQVRDWRNLANTIELVLLQPPRVHNPNGKSIDSAILAQLTTDCCRVCPGMSFPLIITHFHGGSEPHLMRSTRVHNPNGILIGSAVYAQLWQKSLFFTLGAPFFQNCSFPWEIWTPSNTRFLGPIQAHTQTASRSVQPFLQGSLV